MGIQIVRFEKNKEVQWGILDGQDIIALETRYDSLRDFLQHGVEEVKKAREQTQDNTRIYQFDEVNILSPVTAPTQVVCQGANYASHRAESGMESKKPAFNMIFSKAGSSLCGAYSEIVRPPHIRLLDYEIELGLVIGKDITSSADITDENLFEYVAGLVLTNDISARDVQLPQGQWLKGKSYRTFCPTGPILYLLEQEDIPKIQDLEINLWVNDELRQAANTNQLLFKPAETLAELSEVMDLSIGDLILTGTTGGVALQLSSEIMEQIMNPFVNGEKKMELLVKSQLNNQKYLIDGDVIRSEIKSSDGTISLGEQINKVVSSQEKTILV